MAWGDHCPQCGRVDCQWVDGPMCDGTQRTKMKRPVARFTFWQKLVGAERADRAEALSRMGAYQSRLPKRA